jgi:hypothetical protein
MSATAAILQELEQEAATTRRVLERVPSDKLAWKPHDKSMSLGTLAMHVAMSPGFISDWAVQDTTKFAGGEGSPDAKSTAEILSGTTPVWRRRRAIWPRSATPASARRGRCRRRTARPS